MTQKSVLFDSFRVTRDQSTELFAHHVMLAMKFYEAAPEDGEAVTQEVLRIMHSAGFANWELAPVTVFIERLWQMHEDLAK